jgi:hypothetical protein
MNRLFKLQILGPMALFLAVAAAEAATVSLAHWPRSEFLWYVNLELFGLLQRSHAAVSYYMNVPGAQFFGVALPIMLLAVYGLAAQKKLVLALASNLSFAAAAYVLVVGQVGARVLPQASLVTILTTASDGATVWGAVLAASLASALLSHGLYLAAIRREA